MTDLDMEARRWAVVRDDIPLPDGVQGGYDAGHGLIVLSPRLSPVQRRCVLAHEISHARHRDLACRADATVERRADMDAARMLIDQADYMAAEQVNDNPIWMARELDVLPWVVRAYRLWLHETARTLWKGLR